MFIEVDEEEIEVDDVGGRNVETRIMVGGQVVSVVGWVSNHVCGTNAGKQLQQRYSRPIQFVVPEVGQELIRRE